MDTRQPRTEAQSFQFAKFLSWSAFVLIIGTNLVLSLFLADSARRTLLEKQKRFALVLAENLNHQIYQRFTLPTLIGFGRIELKQEAQYQRLDKTVRSTIHSFHVAEVRIYDTAESVAYSTDQDLVGRADLAGRAVTQAFEQGEPSFEIVNNQPTWRAMLQPRLKAGSVILKTTYTLRVDRMLEGPQSSGPIMGVIEFTQDITQDYQAVINFQRLTIGLALASSLGLFLVLQVLMRRADRLSAMQRAERERLERELHQNEKLASMGRMVSGIAHEIRNPLGIIRSSAELLLGKSRKNDGEGAPSQNTRLLQAVFDESKRLSRTVNDFLDYARPKNPQMVEVNLARVLDQGAFFLEPRCQELNVRIKREYPEEVMVRGDKDLLYRAFYNLMANSLEAIGGEGEITVAAGREDDALTLTFSDTGPGFPEDVVSKVRDPFFTTKDTGTGLGLTIVDTIVTAHGGRMDIGNNPGGGARISLRFPLS